MRFVAAAPASPAAAAADGGGGGGGGGGGSGAAADAAAGNSGNGGAALKSGSLTAACAVKCSPSVKTCATREMRNAREMLRGGCESSDTHTLL